MKFKKLIFIVLLVFLIPAILLRSQAVDTREIEKVREKIKLDNKDLQIIDGFLSQAVQELVKTRDFTSVARTRTIILNNQSTQLQYAKQFSQSAYKYISSGFQQAQQLTEERRFKVILNLLILVDGLQDPQLIDLAIARLKDDNKVIRYWAVRCVTNPDLIKKLNPDKEAGRQPLQQITEQLKQVLDGSPPPADEILALITKFTSEVNIPEAEDLLGQAAQVRIKQYADWTVQYELLDSAILKLLYSKMTAADSSKPDYARRFAQLYSFVFQRYLKGQDLNNNNKQYLASVLVEIEDKCLSKLLDKPQSTIKKALESANSGLLLQEYNRLFGDQRQAGELTLKLNIDYGTEPDGKKRMTPQPLPDQPKS